MLPEMYLYSCLRLSALAWRNALIMLSNALSSDSKEGAMSEIVPVILCGGVGSRLWPLSRKSLPKQFAPLIGVQSLFEAR